MKNTAIRTGSHIFEGDIEMGDQTEALPLSIDDYSPQGIAVRVRAAGVAKAKLQSLPLLLLSIMAGAYIALGALLYTLVVADSSFGAGPTRLLGGLVFSLGLVLVVIAGAELFTGNALMVISWLDRKINGKLLFRNWLIVYFGNFIGALLITVLVVLSGVLNPEALATKMTEIAEAKLGLTATEALFRGVLCNMLVCLAVWMSFAARTVTGKVAVILLPIAAFVGIGFEHSVANMYVLPVSMIGGFIDWNLSGAFLNLLFVTIGNIIGGALLVAAGYWAVYLRD